MLPQMFVSVGAYFNTNSRFFMQFATTGTFSMYWLMASLIFASGLFGNMDCLVDVDPVLLPKDSVNTQCWTVDSFFTR